MKSSATVTKNHESLHPDPLVIHPGEELKIGQADKQWPDFVWCSNNAGKSGWVPLDYIDRQGNTGFARCYYSSVELNISIGEQLTIEDHAGGWYWARKQTGDYGWVPAANVIISE